MEGIHTKKLVEEPGEAAIVREIFDMYEQPDTSYGDITRYYAEKETVSELASVLFIVGTR